MNMTDNQHSKSMTKCVFSDAEILALLQGKHDSDLFEKAYEATLYQFDRKVFLRGIIEFSNYCINNCNYCGLRAGNKQLSRYRLSKEEILNTAKAITALGIKTIVLQSGDDYKYSARFIGDVIEKIKHHHDLRITLSLGERSFEELKYWRKLGADRYLLKMETFDRKAFTLNRPKANFDLRLKTLFQLQELGYQVGSGIIVDLPFTNDDTLVSDLQTLSKMNLDMIACGPFISHPQTPWQSHVSGSLVKTHRVNAILRLMNPGANLPATSALANLDKNGKALAIERGCNVIMPSFTPTDYCSNYAIYPGKNARGQTAKDNLAQTVNTIQSVHFIPSFETGDARRSLYV